MGVGSWLGTTIGAGQGDGGRVNLQLVHIPQDLPQDGALGSDYASTVNLIKLADLIAAAAVLAVAVALLECSFLPEKLLEHGDVAINLDQNPDFQAHLGANMPCILASISHMFLGSIGCHVAIWGYFYFSHLSDSVKELVLSSHHSHHFSFFMCIIFIIAFHCIYIFLVSQSVKSIKSPKMCRWRLEIRGGQ